MVIDPKVEEPTRDLIEHAVRGELDELAGLMTELPPERLVECLGLCLHVSAYIAIDVSGPGWPTDAHLRRLAQFMADIDLDFNLEEPDAYAFLSRAALGFEPLYRTGEAHWWEYLDVIERSLEQTAQMPEEAFPALLLWTRRNRAPKTRQAGERTGRA